MTVKHTVLIILLLLINSLLLAQKSRNELTREEYIAMHKPLVMEKMVEFGIPASIAMAQAIVESGNGNSELARRANNHFGIKCHEWTGQTFIWDDDEKNECFRKYRSAKESFHDHSLFLTRRPRYASLFDLDITDYKAWAHGLRSAGYATNQQYAAMLIRIIEENRLHEIDQEVIRGPVLATIKEPEFDDHVYAVPKYPEFGSGPSDRVLFLNNRRLFVFARPGDTYFTIANDFNMHPDKLRRLNDVEAESELKPGALVFTEHKRRRSGTDTHIAVLNETMHHISQIYGIRLRNLLRINNMEPGQEPFTGDVIKLR
jgi:hypothetical protein